MQILGHDRKPRVARRERPRQASCNRIARFCPIIGPPIYQSPTGLTPLLVLVSSVLVPLFGIETGLNPFKRQLFFEPSVGRALETFPTSGKAVCNSSRQTSMDDADESKPESGPRHVGTQLHRTVKLGTHRAYGSKTAHISCVNSARKGLLESIRLYSQYRYGTGTNTGLRPDSV